MSKPTKDTVAQLAKALCQASDDPVLVVSAFAEALHQRGVASCPDDMNDWEVLADVIADVVAPDATPCPEIDDAVEQILRDAGAITVH